MPYIQICQYQNSNREFSKIQEAHANFFVLCVVCKLILGSFLTKSYELVKKKLSLRYFLYQFRKSKLCTHKLPLSLYQQLQAGDSLSFDFEINRWFKWAASLFTRLMKSVWEKRKLMMSSRVLYCNTTQEWCLIASPHVQHEMHPILVNSASCWNNTSKKKRRDV